MYTKNTFSDWFKTSLKIQAIVNSIQSVREQSSDLKLKHPPKNATRISGYYELNFTLKQTAIFPDLGEIRAEGVEGKTSKLLFRLDSHRQTYPNGLRFSEVEFELNRLKNR